MHLGIVFVIKVISLPLFLLQINCAYIWILLPEIMHMLEHEGLSFFSFTPFSSFPFEEVTKRV